MRLRPRLHHQGRRSGHQSDVEQREPVAAALRQGDPARRGRDRADRRGRAELHHGEAERAAGPAPCTQPDDVPGVAERADQREQLTPADRQPAQRQHGEPGGRQRDREPHRGAGPGPQQDGGEQRREHDVHAGDEAGHRRRRRLQTDGLGDLPGAVHQAEEQSGAALPRREPRHRPGRQQSDGQRGDGEADGEEVGRRHAVDDVLEQEERGAPGRRDPEQREHQESHARGGQGTTQVEDVRTHRPSTPAVRHDRGRRRGGG